MKLPSLKHILPAAICVVAFVGVVTAIYLTKPLLPPKISIEFQKFEPEKTKVFHLTTHTNDDDQIFFHGEYDSWWFQAFPSFINFSTEQTNTLCTVYLTNAGINRIWWLPLDCHVEAKTPNGWITNRFGHLTTSPWSVGPSSNDIFNIYVPSDAIEWRVCGSYEYYKRHHVRLEFAGWLIDDLGLGTRQPPKILPQVWGYSLNVVGWILRLLPEPQEQYGETCSKLFTNKPPNPLLPTDQTKP